MGVKKQRLDKLLVAQGFFPTTEAAKRAILAHEVKVNDAFATSAAQPVAPDAVLLVVDRPRFVSRGGLKLEGALSAFSQTVTGLRCIDIGSSTGGFSDCLLQAGAAEVTCVDVNYGMLAWKVRNDRRSRVFERTNIRTVDPIALGAPFDLLVADLSFIGLAGLAPVFARLCRTGSVFIGLIKPQFESAHEETNDHGYVADPAVCARVVREVQDALTSAGFQVTGCVESSITGRKAHNQEYLIRAVFL